MYLVTQRGGSLGRRQPNNDEISLFTDKSKFAQPVKPLTSFIIVISQFVIA
tara:strand:- start:151248 stop:151400 length:153 start_codon:yes stop_codon:yes gene_type:complete